MRYGLRANNGELVWLSGRSATWLLYRIELSNPKGSSTHYLRTVRLFGIPKTINKDYLDPEGKS